MNIGRSIKLFLVDGTSTGLITAEIPNWTGHVLVCPRSRIGEALQREEASKTGVYFLIGEADGRQRVYVGEGDSISSRVKQHAKDPDKEFWERACFVTNKDLNLTKAHVRYLESRLITMIELSGRAALHNETRPPGGLLPEADISDMEFFLAQLDALLATVGFDFLRPKLSQRVLLTSNAATSVMPEKSVGGGDTQGIAISLKHEKNGDVDGRAIYLDGETTVLRGSRGTGSQFKVNQYAPLRQLLIETGSIELHADGSIAFVDDIPFKSPSAAAAVLNNRNSSGPREWRLDGTALTLREHLDSALE